MSENEGRGTIMLGSKKEISPEQETSYQTKIADARRSMSQTDKLKGSRPVGHVERPAMPNLEEASHMESAMMEAGRPVGVEPAARRDRPSTEEDLRRLSAEMKKQQVPEEEASPSTDKKAENEQSTEDLLALLEQSQSPRTEAERIFNNKKRREEIEKRCSEMNFEDLLLKGFVTQKIPVMPDKFTVQLRSITMEEELFCKRFMVDETGNEAYLTSKYSLCQLACALVAINANAYIDHLNHDSSEVNEVQFKKKLKQLQKMSVYIIADLGVNYAWFDLRVRRLMNPETLGNG